MKFIKTIIERFYFETVEELSQLPDNTIVYDVFDQPWIKKGKSLFSRVEGVEEMKLDIEDFSQEYINASKFHHKTVSDVVPAYTPEFSRLIDLMSINNEVSNG